MYKTSFLQLVAVLLLGAAGVAGNCVNAGTSEGPRTLVEGQTACAPLAAGETEADKGKRFVTCSNGRIYEQPCTSSLRYDIASKVCTWPESAKCSLDGEGAPDSTQKVSTTAPPTADPPTSSPNATRKSTTKLYTTLTTRKSVTQSYSASTAPTRPENQTAPTGPCSASTCKLPDCFCYGAQPNVPLADTPMFIMLTFDDAVTSTVYGFFDSLLMNDSSTLRNPSGCPMRAAFYVNHDYTDYSLVKELASKGNEIASHTVNHRLPPGDKDSDYPEAVAEITGMREKVFQGTGDRAISDSMVGFRAPYLLVAHDVQFDALRDNGFLYDTSITNIETFSGRPPLWPFTLDYIMPRCPNVPCPTKPHAGFWEVPINGMIGSDNYGCSMIDTCSVGSNLFTASEDEWYTFYERNFKSYFYPTKVPMHLFTHGSMFLRSPPSFPAMVRWFKDLLANHKDVWIVPPKMVIEWMKKPITYSEMIAQKWGCN
ncbi:hypothetical protein BsWGS_11126 [Bradybaena similaris]